MDDFTKADSTNEQLDLIDIEAWMPKQETLDYIAQTHQKEARQIDKVVETFRSYHTKRGSSSVAAWDRLFIGFCKMQKTWPDEEKPQAPRKTHNIYGKLIIPSEEPFSTIANKIIARHGWLCYKTWYEYCTWHSHNWSIIVTAPLQFTANEIVNRHLSSLIEFAKESFYKNVQVKANYTLDFPHRT